MAFFNRFKPKYADLIPIVFPDLKKGATPTDSQILKMAFAIMENRMKIARDCVRLINETKTPAVFFERYVELLDIFDELSKFEPHREFFKGGMLPSENKREMLSKINETQIDFIERYWNHLQATISNLKTEKAKASKTKNWFEIMDTYNDMLTENSKTRIRWLKSNDGSQLYD